MIAKTHNSQGRLILAVCDEDLLNKRFTEKDKILDLTSGFFNGKKEDKETISSLINKAYIINAAGKKTIELLVGFGVITKRDVLFIEKVPYVQVLFEAKR